MTDHEIIEHRHPGGSSAEDREETVAAFQAGAEESGFGRRTMIRNSLFGALAALGLPAIVFLRDLGPLPGDKPATTVWARGACASSTTSTERRFVPRTSRSAS